MSKILSIYFKKFNKITEYFTSLTFKDFLQELQTIIFKFLNFKNTSVLLIGRDGLNWSITKDRNYVEYFLKLNNIDVTFNIFKATHLFSVWCDIFLKKKYYLLAKLKKILKFKVIGTVTNNIKFTEWKIDILKDIIDLWIAPSLNIYNYLISKNLNVVLIPFYVSEKEFFNLKTSKKIILKKLNLNYELLQNKIVIGSFQRDSSKSSLDKPKWQKNPDLLLKILKKLPNNYYILLLAGPRRHYIVNQCLRHKIPFLYYGDLSPIEKNIDDVFINNHNSSIINLLYNLSDIYIVTSRIEGGPKAILEASLSKTLILSTNVGFTKDFIHKDLIYSEFEIDKVINIIVNFKKENKKINEYLNYNYNKVENVVKEENYKKTIWQLLIKKM